MKSAVAYGAARRTKMLPRIRCVPGVDAVGVAVTKRLSAFDQAPDKGQASQAVIGWLLESDAFWKH